MLRAITRITFASLLLLSATADAEPTGFRTYQLQGHGALQLAVPRSWNDQMRQLKAEDPPMILFTPEKGYGFNMQVTPLWSSKPGATLPSADEIRRTVTRAANDAQFQAADTAIQVKEIQGAAGTGYYFSITDRAPKPEEFKYMTQGMVAVGELVLSFTVLSNDGAEPAVADALKMLKGARQVDAEKR